MASEWKIMGTKDAVPEGYERRMQIVQALSELFEALPIESVTVNGICERAGISKPTFYRYFTDKYDAVNWYHYAYSSRVLYQIGRTLTWHEATVRMFEHVLEERTFYERAFLQSDGYESLASFNEKTNVKRKR